MCLKDDISERHFLVGTEASVSVFQTLEPDTCSHLSSALLEAAKCSAIHTSGGKLITLSINGRKFIAADMMQPLPGADFLCFNTLMVDVKGQ